MKFDIDEALGNGKTYRELVRRGAADLKRRSRAKTAAREILPRLRKTKSPAFDSLPMFTEDTLPEFQVAVIVRQQRGRRWTADLLWIVGAVHGRFAVVPDSLMRRGALRKKNTESFEFASEYGAIAEGARQSQALVDDFVTWATQGVDDV